MPVISRQIGTVSSNLLVFIPDATVSTGAGLANIVASTVRITWMRSDMAAVSSWTMTSGTLGTWSTSSFTQVGSTSTLGLYQVSLPHALFATGDQAAVFLMSSTATMAPVPILIDLSTQVLAVSSIVGVSSVTTPVGVTTGVVSVSSATIPFGVSSISIPVGVSSISTPVTASTAGVTSISIPVSVSSGTVRVSSATIPFGVSSLSAAALGNFFDTGALFFSTAVVSSVVFEIATHATVGGNVGVSAMTIPVGVSSISTPVTASAVSIPVSVSAGTVRVSAATIPFGVSSLSAAALGNFFDTGTLFYSTAVVSSVVFEIATHATATISGNVGVSAMTIPVGVSSISTPVAVSAVTIPVGVSSGSVAVTSATAAVYEAVADTLLARNVSGGGNTGRSVKEALYVLRNKVDAGAGIVYATDDTTSSWAFTVSTQAGNPIVAIDPA